MIEAWPEIVKLKDAVPRQAQPPPPERTETTDKARSALDAERVGESRAMLLAMQHPDWTDEQIAGGVPCALAPLAGWGSFQAVRMGLKQVFQARAAAKGIDPQEGNAERTILEPEQVVGRAATHPPIGESQASVAALTGADERVGVVDDDDAALLSAADLAKRFGLNKNALRKRLERLRKTNHGCFVEDTEHAARSARYLYYLGAVRSVIADMQASAESSAERPPKP